MLQLLRRGQRWLIIATITLVGGVFILYLSGSGSGPGGASSPLVELGDRRYSASDLQLAYNNQEERFREMLGGDFNRAVLDQYIERSARESLVARAVLAHEAEAMGLHVSDEEIRRLLRELFQNTNGTFSAEDMRNYARQNYGNETRFVSNVRDELLVGKFHRLVGSVGFVSKAEARDALRYRGDEIQMAYVSIDPSSFGADAEIDEEAIAAILRDENEHLQADYEAQRPRFHTPERVRASHILFRVDRAADDAAKSAIRTLAQGVLERVLAGEDFAALATEFSQDPGSASNGGSLGFFSRGQMVAPFEEVAFAREPGAPAELVETDFGFHVLRVEEKSAAIDRSFDDVARELAEERYRKQVGGTAARELAESLSGAIRGGATLTDAARAQGLTLERTDWISHSVAGTVEGLGEAPEILDTAFALPDDATSSAEVFEVGDRLVLVERTDRRSADDETIADGIDAERDRILEKWNQTTQSEWLRNARSELVEAGRLKIRFEDEGPPTS